MTNNMLIKDGAGVSKFIHTIEDSTSAHYNMSIPVDSAGNVATVVSATQLPSTAAMGALVVTQRDAIPAGTNLIGSVSISPNGLNIPVSLAGVPNVNVAGAIVSTTGTAIITFANGALYTAAFQYGWDGSNWRRVDIDTSGRTTALIKGQYLATRPTLADGDVSVAQLDTRGNLRVVLVGNDTTTPVTMQVPTVDALPQNVGALTVAAYTMGYNKASSTWDRVTGTSVGLNVVGKAEYRSVLPTMVDGEVSVMRMGSRGALHTQIMGADTNVSWAFGDDNTDNQANVAAGVPKVAGRTFVYDTAGGNWDRWDGKVSVGNTTPVLVTVNSNIAVSVQNNINAVQSGTWTVQPGNTANTTPWLVSVNNAIAVSVQNNINAVQSGTWTVQPGNTANTTPWLVSVNSNIAVSVQNVVNVSVSPNGLNIPVSLGGTVFNAVNDAQGTQTGPFVHNQGQVFNPISSTWDRMTGTSVGQYIQGNASAGATYLGRALIVGGTDGSLNRTLLTTTGGALIVHVSNTAPGGVAGSSMTQTVGAAVTAEGYPMLGSDGTLARRLLTTTGGALVVHVSNAQPTPSGISMTQTVGAAVTTEGYPMLGSDGTLARRLLTTTGGALVVHVSNTAPGGAAGSAMTQTVGAAVTAEGYPMLGSDGTNARRMYVDANGIQRVSVADTTLNVAAALNAGTNLIGGVSVRGIVSIMFEGGSDHFPVSVANALRPNSDKVLIGMVSIGDSIIKTQDVPGTTGGTTVFSQMVSSNTTGVLVKNAAGQVYAVHAFNTLATPLYLKLYDKATAPTVGSDAVKARYVIPGNTGGAGFVVNFPAGTPFTNGIGFGITAGITDNNTTAPTADSAYINLFYT